MIDFAAKITEPPIGLQVIQARINFKTKRRCALAGIWNPRLKYEWIDIDPDQEYRSSRF